MSSAKIELDRVGFDRGVEKLTAEVAALEAQFAELEQKNSGSPALLQWLAKHLAFGAAGQLDWARFKVKLKQAELDRFKTQYERLK